MISLSPKFVFFGLSGIGITVGLGGLVAWRLTKSNKYKTLNSTIPKYDSRVDKVRLSSEEFEEICGESIWTTHSDESEKNSKSKTFNEWSQCHAEIWNKNLPDE